MDDVYALDHQSRSARFPTWDQSFSNLATAAAYAISYFFNRANQTFVIALHTKSRLWYVFPIKALPALSPDNPRHKVTVMFQGKFSHFRTLARSFPPDLFTAKPSLSEPTD